MAAHPVRLVVEDDLRRTRLTVFFRLLLAIPHLIWLSFWTIGVVVFGVAAWVIALVRGRLPDGLHDFLAGYVRYATHLGAYLTLAANPYPGFTGQPGYPVDVEIPGPRAQSRATIAVRLPLAIPALLLSGTLGSGAGAGFPSKQVGGVAAVCGLLGWFASLARGRMPSGLRDLGAYGIGYTAQASAYTLLLTDRYPNADPDELGPAWSLPPHPVRLLLQDDGRRSRLTVAFRLLLALPHIVWLLLWSVAAVLASVASWLVVLVRGRSAATLHRFLAAYVRYSVHVLGFLSLVANPFPGFTGAPGYPVDVAIDEPEGQNRWVTLFRVFLALPALLVASALSGALVVVGLLGWCAALVTGRMPTGLRNLGAAAIRYHAQTDVYWLALSDRYPYASPAVQPPPVGAEN